jgi:hypothetical protein
MSWTCVAVGMPSAAATRACYGLIAFAGVERREGLGSRATVLRAHVEQLSGVSTVLAADEGLLTDEDLLTGQDLVVGLGQPSSVTLDQVPGCCLVGHRRPAVFHTATVPYGPSAIHQASRAV